MTQKTCQGCRFWKGDESSYMAECGHEQGIGRTTFDSSCKGHEAISKPISLSTDGTTFTIKTSAHSNSLITAFNRAKQQYNTPDPYQPQPFPPPAQPAPIDPSVISIKDAIKDAIRDADSLANPSGIVALDYHCVVTPDGIHVVHHATKPHGTLDAVPTITRSSFFDGPTPIQQAAMEALGIIVSADPQSIRGELKRQWEVITQPWALTHIQMEAFYDAIEALGGDDEVS